MNEYIRESVEKFTVGEGVEVVLVEDSAELVLYRGVYVVAVDKKVTFLVNKFVVHDCSTVEKNSL
jgi:hypothetical protein